MNIARAAQADFLAPGRDQPRAHRKLRSHRAFAPMLGVWGAGFGLAIAMVAPVPVVEAFATLMPGDLPAQSARTGLAGGSALALALLAYGAGWGMSRRHHTSTRPQRARRTEVQPLDPASELGSDSFDAPLPAGVLAEASAWLPEEPSPDTLAAEAAAELAALSRSAAAPEETLLPPQELDLTEFAALPGRNAVWVQEAEAEAQTEAQTEAEAEPAAEPNPDPALVSAIARLRAVPPAELSLCEMVERFAAALQEYQVARAASGDTEDARRDREAVLHEALGALGRITGDSRAALASASSPAERAQLWAKAESLTEQRGAA